MQAQLQSKNETSRYEFKVDHPGKDLAGEPAQYTVVVYTNDSGKFIDDSITLNGNELEHEGNEGDTREAILTYLDNNWDKLIG